MNSDDVEHFPVHNSPAIELDMVDFMKHLSGKYICENVDVKDDGGQINPNTINCKTEYCTDLGDISSNFVGTVKQEEGVRKFDVESFFFYYKKLNCHNFMCVYKRMIVTSVKISPRSHCLNKVWIMFLKY